MGFRISNFFKKERNPFKADVILDKSGITIVGAQLGKKPILLGIGTTRKEAKEVEGKIGLGQAGGEAAGAHKQTKELDWKVFYKPVNLPGWFPVEHLTALASGAITATTGSINALDAKVIPISEEKKITITPDISISDKGIRVNKKVIHEKSDRWVVW